jgi:hypothetical protein
MNSPGEKKWDPILLGIIAAALLARLAGAQMVPNEVLARLWEYEDVALSLLKGNGFVYYMRDTPQFAVVHPLYPVICAAVYWLVGHSSLVAMQVVQGAAVVSAAWLAFQMGAALAGRHAGLLAAAGLTLHPALLVFSLRRHSLWFDALLFLATLLATYRLRSSPTTRGIAMLGVLFGISMLFRSTISVFMVFACAWLVWQWDTPVRRSLGRAAIIVGVALLIVSPWLIRNAVVFQRPVGFVSTGGYNLWIGNNPSTTGGALAADGRGMDATDPALAASLRGLDEMEQQDVYRGVALGYISRHPGTALMNYTRKFWSFLFWSDQMGAWYPAWFRVPYQAFYLVLLAFALLGGYRLAGAGHGPAVILLAGFVLSVGIVQSVYFVEGRHRWGVESALIVLAACGIEHLLRHHGPVIGRPDPTSSA